MLLEALSESAGEPSSIPSGSKPVEDKDPKQLFHAFVYKLAHVCDREKGGETVTSIMILDESNVLADETKLTYVFGVNQATHEHLECTSLFLRTILQKVAGAPPKTDAKGRNAAERELRQIVLRFNRPRVRFYLKSLKNKAELCLTQCLAQDNEEDREIAKGLQNLLDLGDYMDTDMTPEAECKSPTTRAATHPSRVTVSRDIQYEPPKANDGRRQNVQNHHPSTGKHLLLQTTQRYSCRPLRRRPYRHERPYQHGMLV